MKIIGASLVRGQAHPVKDRHKGIEACCYPCPGALAEEIQVWAPGIINTRDDLAVVLDDVAICITKIGSLIRTVCQQNEYADIIIIEILKTFDEECLNHKIEKINVFVTHVCTKSEQLQTMKLDYLFQPPAWSSFF